MLEQLRQLNLFRLPEPAPDEMVRPSHFIINGRLVEYRRVAAPRRLTMRIDDRGLRIAAPPRMPQHEIDAFVQTNGEWVLTKLDELAQRHTPRHVCLRDGARLPVLGNEIALRILPGANRIRWIGDTLLLEARTEFDETELARLARRALQRRALDHFGQRLAHYTARLGLPPPALGLSSARTRWGSCSAHSGIRLNWRLIHLPMQVSDYVVAHEVAHLLEMNHSPRFWAVVGDLYPEWKLARRQLKLHAASLPIL